MRAWAAAIAAGVIALSAPLNGESSWQQWRGPLATGEAPNADPPIQWNETRNIRWKTTLPGKGHSTPIVTGDRIFVTAAFQTGEPFEPRHDAAHGTHHGVAVTHRHEFAVIAVNRTNGLIEWQRTVHSELPHEGGHVTGSYASASPITDGELIYAFFGSRGLYALDLDGEVRWEVDLGAEMPIDYIIVSTERGPRRRSTTTP